MKKLLPLFIVIFAFGRVAAQSIPNGGFETWNTSPNWIDPASYGTSNDQDFIKIPGFTANVTQLPSWDGAHGFAVQLKTEAVNGDTLPAFITNSINNPLNGQGGVPYSGQPTGIQLWYNYSPATGDTAGMIVVFKKGGAIIQSYLIPVTVPETTYPLMSFNFIPALTTTPDTVIFAATSSINILQNKNGFAGTTFALSEVEFVGASTPADLNWDFDPWIGDTAFSPQGWAATFPGVSRVTGSNNVESGNYAAVVATAANPNNNGTAQWGGITTGEFNNNVFYGLSGGQPYTKTYDTLEFYYKYTQATPGVDSGWAEEDLVRHDSIVLDLFAELPPASTFQHWGIIDTLADGNPDSVIVTFESSTWSTPPQSSIGSYLIVDDVEFTSQATGIKPVLLADNSLLIYPNPASSYITIGSSQAAINEVRLDNILGQMVLDKNYADGVAGLKENIDVSNLPSGLYFITITSAGKTSTGKIMVNR